MKLDLSWLWDKYAEIPENAGEQYNIMRSDIFYLMGVIDGMALTINSLEGKK